jgi:hypothetical protein
VLPTNAAILVSIAETRRIVALPLVVGCIKVNEYATHAVIGALTNHTAMDCKISHVPELVVESVSRATLMRVGDVYEESARDQVRHVTTRLAVKRERTAENQLGQSEGSEESGRVELELT